MKWVLVLIVAAVAGFFGYQHMQKNAALDAENAVVEAAQKAAESSKASLQEVQEAMPEGVDLSKISGALDGVFGSASSTLKGITDVESAKAAIPSLELASEKLDGVAGLIRRLPEAAKGPIGGMVEAGISTLQPLIDKASALPGVGPVLEPVITPMVEMLNGISA